MSSAELACGYAALLLHGDGIPITAEKIATVVKAANVQVASYWPLLFAKLLEKWSVDDLILSVGSGGEGAAPVAMSAAPAAGGAAAAAAPAFEEKKDTVLLTMWRWLIGGIDKFAEVRRGWIQKSEGWVRNDMGLGARVPQK